MSTLEMKCAEVREQLAAYADGEATLALRRHLSRCPDCRAVVASYEAMADSLAALRSETAESPPGLQPALVAIATRPGKVTTVRVHVRNNRNAYAGGAALAALGLSAVLWRTKSRRLATA